MGNENSKSHKPKPHNATAEVPAKRRDTITEEYFNNLSGHSDSIDYKRLEELFSEDLADSLWTFFAGDKPKSNGISFEEFEKKSSPLMGTSTDVYVKVLQPVHHFIKVCSDCAGAPAIRGDEHFINILSEKIGTEESAMIEWRRSFCPRFCNEVQSLIISRFTGRPTKEMDYSSDILTPLQMWFLQASLPQAFFPNKDDSVSQHWTPLYTSLQHGISTNRFETLVFDYRGPTVTVLRLTDKRVVALASDQEWRHGSTRFGGPATCLFELYPDIKRYDAPSSIYCNLKIRSASFGVSFKEIVKIDKDFNQVRDIEVWGCSGASTLAEQQKLKNWQKQQAEKHKKVPLPGNWDDNPDKSLLEMAGFQFSNERENMEREALKQENDKVYGNC